MLDGKLDVMEMKEVHLEKEASKIFTVTVAKKGSGVEGRKIMRKHFACTGLKSLKRQDTAEWGGKGNCTEAGKVGGWFWPIHAACIHHKTSTQSLAVCASPKRDLDGAREAVGWKDWAGLWKKIRGGIHASVLSKGLHNALFTFAE